MKRFIVLSSFLHLALFLQLRLPRPEQAPLPPLEVVVAEVVGALPGAAAEQPAPAPEPVETASPDAVAPPETSGGAPAVPPAPVMQPAPAAQSFAESFGGIDLGSIVAATGRYIACAASSLRTLCAIVPLEEIASLEGKGGSAFVRYGADGQIVNVTIITADEPVEAILRERIPWRSLPRPSMYHLPYETVVFSVAFSRNGSISVAVSPA